MRVLVIGGAGFLGGYAVEALARRGHDVSVLDRVAPRELEVEPEFIAADILDAQVVADAVAGFDAVFHFAGQPDIGRSLADPGGTIATNVLGTTNVLEACRLHGTPRLLFASTVYVFSRNGGFYGASKACCERLIEEYAKQTGLEYTIIRYGSVYGPRAGDTNRIHRILAQALSERRIVFPGDGSEQREYIHARDAAELSVDALEPRYANEHLILTGIECLTYSDLLTLVRDIVGEDVSIEYENRDYAGHYKLSPYSFEPRLSRKLTANPAIDLGQGLLGCLRQIHATRDPDAKARDEVCDEERDGRSAGGVRSPDSARRVDSEAEC